MRWEHLYWANSMDLRDDLLAHSGETENFWIEYSRRRLVALGVAPALAGEYAPKVSAHMGAEYKPESIVPEDVRNVLPQLKQAGYILAVLSNRDKPFVQLLEDHRIGEFFDFSIAAGEVNTYKPDPGLFEHAIQRAEVLCPGGDLRRRQLLCGCGRRAPRRADSHSRRPAGDLPRGRLHHDQNV